MMQDLTGMPAVGERIDTGSVALGLPEFVVLAAGEYAGQVELLVETTESVTGCPRCGVVATLHDRKPRWVRDLPVGGRPVVLMWFKRVWRCVEPACGQRTWSERTVAIRARSVLTERARVECARRVGQDATDVARVATDLGVGWGTVMRGVGVRPEGLGLPVAAHQCHRPRAGRDRFPQGHRRQRHPVPDRDGGPAPGDRWPGPAARRGTRPLRDGGHRLAGRTRPALVHPGASRRAGPVPRLRAGAARRAAGDRGAGLLPRRPVGPARDRRRPPPGPAGDPRAPRPQARPAVPDPPDAAARGGEPDPEGLHPTAGRPGRR